jgi:hypothetical protein
VVRSIAAKDWRPGRSCARFGRTGGRECDDGDGARRHALVLGECRIPLGLRRVLVVAFGALQVGGMRGVPLRAPTVWNGAGHVAHLEDVEAAVEIELQCFRHKG